MADLLLAKRFESTTPPTGKATTPPTVGEHWVQNFIKRDDELKSKYNRKYDYQRAKCEDPRLIREWFKRVHDTVEQYGIVPEDYYNFDEATQKFTNFPTLTYLYNTSEGHKAIGEYLAATVASVGITMNLENQEWNTFLNTRKNGEYSVARNGWLADYNDPICFLDMWVSGSGNNDVQYGKGAHAELAMYNLDLTGLGIDVKVENGTWAQTYDVLISKIKACTDTTTRYALMHVAEDMLMATGCITPLYYYTDIYMLSDKVDGFFSNPLGYKYLMYTTIGE